ncbi:MAG: molecular chaperone [Deltaproteobacteria bacterium]
MKLRHQTLQRCLLFLFCLGLLGGNESQAVTIFPTRVVMNDKDRTAQVEIVNSGTETESYSIQLERKRMTETGEFNVISGEILPGELFADQIVRYSPHRITLAPGAGQTVRLMLKMPDGLLEGEYRSHLSVNRIPEASNILSPEKQEKEPTDINIKLTAYANIAIPVIVRHGKLNAQLEIRDVVLRSGTGKEPSVVEFTMLRKGTMSVYGDIAVTFMDENNKIEQVAAVNGVAVYVPNATRKARLTLRGKETLPAKGTLRVTFTEHGASKPMAEASIPIR